jgi:hypothetical protein
MAIRNPDRISADTSAAPDAVLRCEYLKIGLTFGPPRGRPEARQFAH